MTDPDFNALTSASFREDPYPILARLRETTSVVHLAPGLIESWHILGYDDVSRVMLDTETFSSNRALVGSGKLADANLNFLFNNLISATGDRHRRLRMIGNRVFMPKFVESFRPKVHALVNERMDFALQNEEFDLVEEFAAEITVGMVCAVLGLPREDKQQIRHWSAVLGENSGASTWLAKPNPDLEEKGRKTGEALVAYFRDYMKERRVKPKEGDLVSAFMSVEVDGERLSDDEIMSMAMLLLLAGNESTTNLITNFVRIISMQGNVNLAIRADPERIPAAVEETLRMRSSVRNVDRVATCDVEVGGVIIPKGGLTIPWLTSANRDPKIFSDPDKFILGRKPNRHLGFGLGMHLCLGAPLARMEAQIIGEAIVKKTNKIELLSAATRGTNANFDAITRQIVQFHGK